MASFQSSELTKLPVVENSQLFAQRVHSTRTAHGTPPCSGDWLSLKPGDAVGDCHACRLPSVQGCWTPFFQMRPPPLL